VAEIDADAEPNAPLVGNHRLAIDHPSLYLSGAAYCVNHTRKFRHKAVAGVLYNTASVLLDFRIKQPLAMRFEASMRAFLVPAHQTRIARHIGGEDRGETAGRGHGCGSPPWGDRTGLNYSTARPGENRVQPTDAVQSVSSSRLIAFTGFRL